MLLLDAIIKNVLCVPIVQYCTVRWADICTSNFFGKKGKGMGEIYETLRTKTSLQQGFLFLDEFLSQMYIVNTLYKIYFQDKIIFL